MGKTLAAMQQQNWTWGGVVGYARYEFSDDFVSEDGIEFEGGSKSYLEVACTISGNIFTVPPYPDFPVTENAVLNNHVTVTCHLLDSNRKKRTTLFEDCRIFESLPPTVTLAQLVLANGARQKQRETTVWTKEQTIDYIDTLPPAGKASLGLAGITELTKVPVDLAHPKAVADNDERVNVVKVANFYSGATVAQQINAAFAALNGLPGEVWHFGGGDLGGGTSADPAVNTNIVVVKSFCTLRLFPGTYTSTNERPRFQLENDSSLIGVDNRTVIIEESTAAPTANLLEFCCIAAKGHVGPAVAGVGGNGSTSRNITIKNIQIKGVRSNSNSAGKAIDVGNLHGGEISGVVISGGNGQGIHIGGASGATSGGDSLGLGRYADGVIVRKCLFTNVAAQAVALVNCQNVTVEKTIHLTPGRGSSGMGGGGIAPIDVEPNGATDRMANILIEGNTIDFQAALVSGTPILIQNTVGLTDFGVSVKGNVIKGGSIDGGFTWATYCIAVKGSNARDVLIEGNFCCASTAAGIYTEGLRTQIKGNYVAFTGSTNAIQIAATARHALVGGNTLYGASTPSSSGRIIEDVGADYTTVIDNYQIGGSASGFAHVTLTGANSRQVNNFQREGTSIKIVDGVTRSSEMGTLTTSTPARQGTATWNNAAVAFIHDTADITDTASHANSLLIERKVGGAQKFTVRKDGALVAALSVSTPTLISTADIQASKTVTAGGTTGAQTINKTAGSVNFAIGATSLVVTNSLVTASSIIICTVATNDATMKSVLCVAGAGSFTIHANAAPTGECRVNFLIIN